MLKMVLVFAVGVAVTFALMSQFWVTERDSSSHTGPVMVIKREKPVQPAASRLPRFISTTPVHASEKDFKIAGVDSPSDRATQEEDIRTIRSFILSTLDENNQLAGAHVMYGDVNGDGVPDAVVNYSIEPVGGNSYEQYLSVYLRSNSQLVHSADMKVGAKGMGVAAITAISGNTIYLDTLKKADSDPYCCPSIKGTAQVVLSDNRLVELTNRTAEKKARFASQKASEQTCLATNLGVTEQTAAELMQDARAYYQAKKMFGPGYGETASGMDQATYQRLTYVSAMCMMQALEHR